MEERSGMPAEIINVKSLIAYSTSSYDFEQTFMMMNIILAFIRKYLFVGRVE